MKSMGSPFILVAPSTRGLSLALTRHFLRSTDMPVFATHRNGSSTEVHKSIMSSLGNVDGRRLTLLPMDLSTENSIEGAAAQLSDKLPSDAYLETAIFTGGVLHPEKNPTDLSELFIQESFRVNVISHLLLIKHFSRFLPSTSHLQNGTSKWVHISARVGSISDNRRGGWYSYRSSKAALNQVIKTFDIQLQMRKAPTICVGIHPGTVKTGLSQEFWNSVPNDKLFEPEFAAGKVIGIINSLTDDHRGRVWDYAGKLVPW